MPSDAAGAYSLPTGYLAQTGETIQASQHNPPLEDLASAMTARLPKSGVAPMTGPLQLANGTSTAPSLTLASNTTSGLYASPSGKLAMVNVLGATPIGGIIDYAGSTAPAGWLLCYGQSLLRADYPDLYNAIGVTYGAADGTHFSLPDCRGRASFGKDNMGGVAATRLFFTIAADLGATGGAERETIAQAQLPALTWPSTLAVSAISDTRTWVTPGDVLYNIGSGGVWISSSPGGNWTFGARSVAVASGSLSGGVLSGSITSGGGGNPLTTLPPAIIFNKIIFAGV
jgi:microcystin-dependent protein